MRQLKESMSPLRKGRPAKAPLMTGADLLQSGLVGLWASRKDVKAPSFARRLRQRAARRVQPS